jgi:DNA (cytosine-5)-methyltransferase 1
MKPVRILNNYAGIGGNRKLWTNVQVTAVENNPEIAAIYKEYFPEDTVIIGDAHQYLLKHYKEFDLIWGSPPCQTNSRSRMWSSKGGGCAPKYPDMTLWQEIIFLREYCGDNIKWVLENVIPYYSPLVKPRVEIDRHLFWSNFTISWMEVQKEMSPTDVGYNTELYGFSMQGRKLKTRKDQILRNCVHPDVGLHVLNCAIAVPEKLYQQGLFNQ